MRDPYTLLGIPRDADDEAVKHAYRELVRKYHPDKYAGTDLADMATEKMKEINAAYEEIMQERKRGASASGGSNAAGDGNPYTQYQNAQNNQGRENASLYAAVRMHINAGRTDDAAVLLDSVPAGARNAEWHFLMGCVLIRQGHLLDAEAYLQEACRREPENAEYRAMESRLRTQMRGGTFYTSYTPPPENSSLSGCCSDAFCNPCSPFFFCNPCC